MPDFISDLAIRLTDAAFRNYAGNDDPLRFPAGIEAAPEPSMEEALQMMGWVRDLAAPLNFTYALLADDYSRRVFLDVMAYRILGHRRVKLSRHDQTYQSAVASLPSLATKEKTVPVTLLDGWLNHYKLQPLGFAIEADLHPLNVLYTYQLQQYRYHHDGAVVEPKAGDIAIDGGGCWGDTALYLADRVGQTGRVYCFEFSPDNLPTLEANLSHNPKLKDRVHLQKHALWSHTGETFSFNPAGPGTRLGNAGSFTTTTLTIDDLAARERLPRVDFIKMDIEGAELDALKGAEQTIRSHRPRLAVTLYHRLQDFATIPRFIHDLDLGYRFYVDHFSINHEETVMFASAS